MITLATLTASPENLTFLAGVVAGFHAGLLAGLCVLTLAKAVESLATWVDGTLFRAPSRRDSSDFDARADAFLDAMCARPDEDVVAHRPRAGAFGPAEQTVKAPQPKLSPLSEEMPIGCQQAILAELRALREEAYLARHGVGRRPEGDGWSLMRRLDGTPLKWFRRPVDWGSDEASPQAPGPSDE